MWDQSDSFGCWLGPDGLGWLRSDFLQDFLPRSWAGRARLPELLVVNLHDRDRDDVVPLLLPLGRLLEQEL